MSKPTLVILAAGMASRYGGNKQIDPVDAHGNAILDYSVFDAARAGFEDVVVVIRPELEDEFRQYFIPRMQKKVRVRLAFQTHSFPRKKPLGTAHAVLAAREFVDGPFAVINSDDLYGRTVYSSMFDFLTGNSDKNIHAMAGYLVENTLSENGTVKRGVCTVKDGELVNVVETFGLVPKDGGATDDDGVFYPAGTNISMSFWGFMPSIFDELQRDYEHMLATAMLSEPDTCELLLPETPGRLVRSGQARVKVLPVADRWYGVTYKDDMPEVQSAIRRLVEQGVYPEDLWA